MKNLLFKKKAAEIEIVSGMYLLIMLVVLLSIQLQISIFRVSASFVEDALAASNLASAVIDVEEYGRTQVIQIASPESAYQLYQEAIRYNLNLDEHWKCQNQYLIGGQVEIQEYTVYNVIEQDVMICSFRPEGISEVLMEDGLGSVKAPDGTVVESTSVYSRVGFPIRGIFGLEIAAVKHKTVDIVSNFPLKEE